jgi:uncharacterized membrane protein (UPF0136 family)
MDIKLAIATVVGAAIFPFLIRILWGKLCATFGPIGGFMAAGWIVGTTWAFNHFVGAITQSGDAWIDMGLAAGVGLIVASTLRGGKFAKAVPNILAALVAGVLGGFILSFYLK